MITLAPLSRNQNAKVAHLHLKPEQSRFVRPVLDTLKTAEPTRDFHIILNGQDVVGFFSIDQTYHIKFDFAHSGDIGLFSFQIGRDFQGKGYATQATKLLKPYLAGSYPKAKSIVLTVNCKNPAAYACYISGGFIDTGTPYLGGDAGPQFIMRLIL